MKYRKKPVVIEAIQWDGEDTDAVESFAGSKMAWTAEGLTLEAGKEGAQEWVPVPVGHWLVHQPGDLSDIWPVAPAYFAAKYQLVRGGEGTVSDERG